MWCVVQNFFVCLWLCAWLLVVGGVGGEKILRLGGFLFGGGSVFFCVWVHVSSFCVLILLDVGGGFDLVNNFFFVRTVAGGVWKSVK